MQVLQGIGEPESGPHVQMNRGVTKRREIDQNRGSVILLERYGRIDGHGRRTSAALGVQKSEHSRSASVILNPGARGGETGQSILQRNRVTGALQVLHS